MEPRPTFIGRSRVGGINPDDLRVHLDRESLRILTVHRPAVFVMENVRGILSARVGDKPVISQILDDLQQPTAAIRKSSGKRNGRGAEVVHRAWSREETGKLEAGCAGRPAASWLKLLRLLLDCSLPTD